MFQTMTQIGKDYNIDAKTVGKLLYKLKVRDPNHTEQKGYPFEQAVTHGIAKAFEGRSGEMYYRYNIETIKEEFEKLVSTLPVQNTVEKSTETSSSPAAITIETKLQQMLTALNDALQSGEISQLYRLKADIADIYALLSKKEMLNT
ncbi:MAG: hypothetical protein PF439_10660 [Helicobacteraceae bacterium]|jgi:hypothetical protein|nr:hypothetical protein [Helicobacteraceae bacterium]